MAEDFKKLVKEGTACVGARETIAALKSSMLKKVYLASNCPAPLRADILHLASFTNTAVENLPVPNEELGIMCKKQFSISVLGVKKDAKKK